MFADELVRLAAGNCVPPDGQYRLLGAADCEQQRRYLPPEWGITADQQAVAALQRRFRCRDYPQAAALTQRIATLAEAVNHHPSLLLEWCQLTLRINTHAVNGLAIGDFVFAAKAELLARKFGVIDESN
ncbi:MAG: 4a-hydroxytetrahydrobiopterin dehydratase [Gammaproteobacteria bacterium]